MELLAEAREAARATRVAAPPAPAAPPLQARPATAAAGLKEQLVQQSALCLFRDALLSNSALDAAAGSNSALDAARARDADASSRVECQRIQLRVLAESVARINGTVAGLSRELGGEADKLAAALAAADPSLPSSITLQLPTGTAVTVTSEEQARDIMAGQVLETSAAIAEAFRLQHEADAARAAGVRLEREISELEAALAQQRAPAAEALAKTRAAQLAEAQQYYGGLSSILRAACGATEEAPAPPNRR